MWLEHHKLTLNIEKTEYIIIKNKNKTQTKIKLKIDNQKLREVEHTKYLGIIIDENLTWSLHINKIIKTIAPK